MNNNLQTTFKDREKKFSSELKETKSVINKLVWIRTIVGLLFLVCLALLVKTSSSIYGIALLVLIVIFIILVNYHQNFFDKKVILEQLKIINAQELQALAFDFSSFQNGTAFINSAHSFTSDLDIFGENSLYQHINRCCTLSGKKKLAQLLANSLNDKNEIESQQKLYTELSKKLDFRQNFQANGNTISENENEIDNLIAWFNDDSKFLNNTFLNIIRFLLPALIIGAMIGSYFSSKFMGITLILFFVSWGIYTLFSVKINDIHSKIGSKHSVLNKYLKLIKIINQEQFQHPKLQNLKQKLQSSEVSLNQFSKIISDFDNRLNVLVSIVLNTVFLYDFHCVFKLEKWKENNKKHIEEWLNLVALQDAYNSFGNYVFTKPSFCFPVIDNNKLEIKGSEIGHPLMKQTECIANSISFGINEKSIILTGANMSGKSTFLRSLGLNTLLALLGLPVYAKSFKTSIFNIHTSMRVTDSLNERASYFYAELSRLQEIVQKLEQGNKMLILLDEVLKGTNSDDKLSGSIELVKKFLQYECLHVIATHDLKLGELENKMPKKISNYCFESIIQENELYFDYKLGNGIAKNKNASFLMKKMKII